MCAMLFFWLKAQMQNKLVEESNIIKFQTVFRYLLNNKKQPKSRRELPSWLVYLRYARRQPINFGNYQIFSPNQFYTLNYIITTKQLFCHRHKCQQIQLQIIMKRVNNKIKNKHQTTFLTQAHQPLFVKAEKRAKSLNPRTSAKINSNQLPFQNISARLSYLNPFSHYQAKSNFNDQLNDVVSQFKNISKKNILNTSINESRHGNGICKSSVKDFKSELRHIIKRSKAKGERHVSQYQTIQRKRSKTVQQNYDDMQNQSANNLIQQSKRQKKYFKQALNKFNHLLRDASAVFIQHWNVNINPKKAKQFKVNDLINQNLVNHDHKDEVYFYEGNYLSQKKNKYNFGKQIGMFLKSKDRVMKTQQDLSIVVNKNKNSRRIRDNLKYTIKQPENDEKVVLQNYFKSKKSKREFLRTSIPSCSQL